MRHSIRRILETFAAAVILVVGLFVAIIAPADPRDRHIRRGHETSDVYAPGVLAAAGALLVMLAMAVVLSSWLEARFTGQSIRVARPPAAVGDGSAPSALTREQPRPQGALPLSGAPAEAMAALRASETERLTTYGWVDQAAGIVRLPIDRAMDLIAGRAGAAPGNNTPSTGRPAR